MRITIVDDVPNQIENLVQLLKQAVPAASDSISFSHVLGKESYETAIRGIKDNPPDILICDLGLVAGGAAFLSQSGIHRSAATQAPALCAELGIQLPSRYIADGGNMRLSGLVCMLTFVVAQHAAKSLLIAYSGILGDEERSLLKSACARRGVTFHGFISIADELTQKDIADAVRNFSQRDPFDNQQTTLQELCGLLSDQFVTGSSLPHYLHLDTSGASYDRFVRWAQRHFPGIDLSTKAACDGALEAAKGFATARYPACLGTLALLALFMTPKAPTVARFKICVSEDVGRSKLTQSVAATMLDGFVLLAFERLFIALGGNNLERCVDISCNDAVLTMRFRLKSNFSDLCDAFRKTAFTLAEWLPFAPVFTGLEQWESLQPVNKQAAMCPLETGSETTRALVAVQLMTGMKIDFVNNCRRPVPGAISFIALEDSTEVLLTMVCQ